MTAVDIISLSHIAVTSIPVVRALKQHRDRHRELKDLLARVEEASDKLQLNISCRKEALGVAHRPSLFLDNILNKIQKVCNNLSALKEDMNLHHRPPPSSSKLLGSPPNLRRYWRS